MVKKKLAAIAATLALTLSAGCLFGCGASEEASNEAHYSDQEFLASMSKGLIARWDAVDALDDEASTVNELEQVIQAELDELTPYESATFEDTELQEKAISYINTLKDQKENARYYFSTEKMDKWNEPSSERLVLIKQIADEYGLTVDEAHQDEFDQLVANGQVMEEEAGKEAAINKLVKSLKFERTKEEYGWKTYTAIAKNNTGYNIKELSIDITLLDKDGVNIGTQWAYAENVADGEKVKLEFETDESFKKLKIETSYFEAE